MASERLKSMLANQRAADGGMDLNALRSELADACTVVVTVRLLRAALPCLRRCFCRRRDRAFPRACGVAARSIFPPPSPSTACRAPAAVLALTSFLLRVRVSLSQRYTKRKVAKLDVLVEVSRQGPQNVFHLEFALPQVPRPGNTPMV